MFFSVMRNSSLEPMKLNPFIEIKSQAKKYSRKCLLFLFLFFCLCFSLSVHFVCVSVCTSLSVDCVWFYVCFCCAMLFIFPIVSSASLVKLLSDSSLSYTLSTQERAIRKKGDRQREREREGERDRDRGREREREKCMC